MLYIETAPNFDELKKVRAITPDLGEKLPWEFTKKGVMVERFGWDFLEFHNWRNASKRRRYERSSAIAAEEDEKFILSILKDFWYMKARPFLVSKGVQYSKR
jgi:hypothetical protein